MHFFEPPDLKHRRRLDLTIVRQENSISDLISCGMPQLKTLFFFISSSERVGLGKVVIDGRTAAPERFFEIETTHWWFTARQKIVSDVIQQNVILSHTSKVLDVGCGTGAILAMFQKSFDVRHRHIGARD